MEGRRSAASRQDDGAREQKDCRRLEVGDTIKSGQLVAFIDPDLAMTELAIKTAMVDAAESELRASTATKHEFDRRVAAIRNANKGGLKVVSEDDYQTAVLQRTAIARKK